MNRKASFTSSTSIGSSTSSGNDISLAGMATNNTNIASLPQNTQVKSGSVYRRISEPVVGKAPTTGRDVEIGSLQHSNGQNVRKISTTSSTDSHGNNSMSGFIRKQLLSYSNKRRESKRNAQE